MKKIILFAVTALLFAGCTKDLSSLNQDPKNPVSLPSTALFTNAQRTLSNTLTSTNVNLNIFRLVVQYWQETTYTDESRYDIVTRQIPDNMWDALNRDVLRDFREVKAIIPTEASSAKTQKNQLAITDIMEIYTWYYLVTSFGDVPYSQALDVKNTFPKYDNQKTVFADLLTRLDTSIAALDITGSSFGTADIIYSGDVAAWKKFANSLKLKMGMTIADDDAARAKTVVESAVASGVFTSNNNNAMFKYVSSPPNTNPVWVDLVQGGRKDFIANSTIVNAMNASNDPRRPYYFTVDNAGNYSGNGPGRSSSFSTFSKPAGLIKQFNPGDVTDAGRLSYADFPGDLLDYAEVSFLLAEAVERGFSVGGGTAASYYNNAITASVLFWGGSAASAATYLAQPTVAYASAAGTYKQKIGTQKWIALYNRGWDAWIEQRRLDYPVLPKPSNAASDYPVRFTYPINEQNVNTVNYTAAATAIGGDDVVIKLFWDKF
ncbi:MAG: SusD/RagB family nutrient-binding outer membrane lipoprotein [Chitinophagaceae bacterium]